MKQLIISLLMLININLFAQTRDQEVKYLNSLITEGKLTNENLRQLGQAWRKLLEEFGGYPDLPYNEKKDIIEFIEIQEFPTLSKEILFNRIKEFAAITFGSLSEVLHYENYESGKIILKGFFNIRYRDDIQFFFRKKEGLSNAKCTQTYIFTLKDKKLKINIMDINYLIKGQYVQLLNIYTPDNEFSIHNLYPVTASEQSEWKPRLSLIQETNQRLAIMMSGVVDYINEYESDYSFE